MNQVVHKAEMGGAGRPKEGSGEPSVDWVRRGVRYGAELRFDERMQQTLPYQEVASVVLNEMAPIPNTMPEVPSISPEAVRGEG